MLTPSRAHRTLSLSSSALLVCCNTEIGNIGHSRENMGSIIYRIEKVINRKTADWLSMALPSKRLSALLGNS